MDLKGKVVVLTGASSGIGEATARTLAAEGALLVLAARRVDRLQALAGELESAGAECVVHPTDVTKRADCEAAVLAGVERWGRLDVLVNNAGLMPLSMVDKRKVDEWERMVDVNIKGVLFMTAAALPHLEASGEGFIVNISSVAGRKLFPGASVYCATKFAVSAFSEGLRMELSPSKNIRVVSIEPGAVLTELTDTITDEDVLENLRPLFESIKALDADDIARAIQYVLKQPAHVNINEVLIRPTQQDL